MSVYANVAAAELAMQNNSPWEQDSSLVTARNYRDALIYVIRNKADRAGDQNSNYSFEFYQKELDQLNRFIGDRSPDNRSNQTRRLNVGYANDVGVG
jgi:hypothetical protein